MTEIQQIIDEMVILKQQSMKEFKQISYYKNRSQSNQSLKLIIPNKKELYQTLKNSFKQPWTDPGYCNNEFENILRLPPKILNPWELFKAQESIRVVYPKNFNGFKVSANYQEFGTPQMHLYPLKAQEFIKQKEKSNQDYFQRPSQYGKTHVDQQLDHVQYNKQKKQFCQSNSQQINMFGFDQYSTYKAEKFLRKIKKPLNLKYTQR